jgi:hypothetical protein
MDEASARVAAKAIQTAFQTVWKRDPTVNELTILAAHAYLESDWGRARFRSYPAGVPSGTLKTCPRPPDRGTQWSPVLNNWGAVQIRDAQATPENAWGPGCDSNKNGVYPAMFRRYPTPAAGALDYVRVVTTEHGRATATMPALKAGDVAAYVDAQLKTVYFTEAENSTRADKIRGIAAAARQFAQLVGLPFPETVTVVASPVGSVFVFLGAIAAIAAVYRFAQKGD